MMRIYKDGKQIGVRDANGDDFYFKAEHIEHPPKNITVIDPMIDQPPKPKKVKK